MNETEKLKADKTLFLERIVFLEDLLEKHKIHYRQEKEKEGLKKEESQYSLKNLSKIFPVRVVIGAKKEGK